MKNLKKTKGITLISLVITIIILVILAGITISSLTGSGLFQKAELAKEKTDTSQINENEILKEYEDILNGHVDGSRDTVTISKEEYDKLKNTVEQLNKDMISYKNKFDNYISSERTLISCFTTNTEGVPAEINTQIEEYNYIEIAVGFTNWGEGNLCKISVKDLKERYNASDKFISIDYQNNGGAIYYNNGKIYVEKWGSYTFNIYGIK